MGSKKDYQKKKKTRIFDFWRKNTNILLNLNSISKLEIKVGYSWSVFKVGFTQQKNLAKFEQSLWHDNFVLAKGSENSGVTPDEETAKLQSC